MAKIVIIGAGSHVFTRNLVTDFLSYPELRDSTISLMDIDEERLDLVTSFTRKIVSQHGYATDVESTTDRRTALEGADYVILSIRVGGLAANRLDLKIPAKYGIVQGIGDTIGPGGVFYGLRHIPVILDICSDMEELCPDAWLLNYTNPMAMICWAVNDHSNVKNIGLCHSVQGTASELARYIGAPLDEVQYWVAARALREVAFSGCLVDLGHAPGEALEDRGIEPHLLDDGVHLHLQGFTGDLADGQAHVCPHPIQSGGVYRYQLNSSRSIRSCLYVAPVC